MTVVYQSCRSLDTAGRTPIAWNSKLWVLAKVNLAFLAMDGNQLYLAQTLVKTRTRTLFWSLNMQTITKTSNVKIISMMAFMAGFLLIALEPAFAQGGLDKVNTFVENVLIVLRGVSIGVVTIAIMVAGYKFLFKHADIAEVSKILAGGLLIGGAAELSRYLLT